MVKKKTGQRALPSSTKATASTKPTDSVETATSTRTKSWNEMVDRLANFQTEHGHCNVPVDFIEDPSLGKWVASQRTQFAEFGTSSESPSGKGKSLKASQGMTQERFQKLKAMGFEDKSIRSWTDFERSDEERRDDAPGSDGESQGNNHKRDRETTQESRQSDASSDQPKKRRKTWKDWKNEVAVTKSPSLSEQRDAPVADTRRSTIGQSPASSSAFETLMNVAALVPPLPEPKPGKKTFKTPIKRTMSAVSEASVTGSTKSNADVISNQARWEAMFAKLKEYKELHGTCNVPNRYPQDPALGSWVATQRRYYKSKHLPMPEDRIKLLTDLGMEWSTKDPRKVPWMTRFLGLKAFMAKYGHCDVPHEFEEFPQLGFWVANQRQQYRYLQLGRKSALNNERIELLNSLGFVWKLQGGRRRKSSGETSEPPSPTMLHEPANVGSSEMPCLLLDPELTMSPKAAAVKYVVDAARTEQKDASSNGASKDKDRPKSQSDASPATIKKRKVVLLGSEKDAAQTFFKSPTKIEAI